jgi:hypothetical protein
MGKTEVPADRAMLKLLVRTCREVGDMDRDSIERLVVMSTVLKLVEQYLDDTEETNNG